MWGGKRNKFKLSGTVEGICADGRKQQNLAWAPQRWQGYNDTTSQFGNMHGIGIQNP